MIRKPKAFFAIVGACAIVGAVALMGYRAENRDQRGEAAVAVAADRGALSADEAYRHAQATFVMPQGSWEQLFMHGR